MDNAVLVLIIILVFILGIYGFSQIGGSESNVNYTYKSYPSQYSGGGCGR